MHSSIIDAKVTHVKELFVVPDYRNNGIALKLIEAVVKFAIENKSAFIQLKTVRDNLIAQRLFESVGFTSQSPFTESKVYSIQFS
jgi:ribosomal protein S18 acetylase RimI-like enzyme